MKRKLFLFGIVGIIIILICIYRSIFISPKLTVKDLEIEDAEIDENNDMYEYGITGEEIEALKQNDTKIKCVIIYCAFDNKFSFKNIYEAELAFENNKELPDIILGTHPDEGFEPLNIRPNRTSKRGITILIDPKEYNNKEIIEMLKNVKIVIVQKTHGKIKIESKPVALEALI